MVTKHVTQLSQHVGEGNKLHSFLREQNEIQSC